MPSVGVKSFNILINKMTVKVPKELGNEYWTKTKEERLGVWVKLLTDRLKTTENDARAKIEYIRKLPVFDYHTRSSPRTEAAAQTLYEMSSKCPYHNRTHGPELGSSSLISKLCGTSSSWHEDQFIAQLKKLYGRVSFLHVQKKLSESNVHDTFNSLLGKRSNSDSLQDFFTEYDIRRGIKLPKFSDETAVRCLGYAYGDGFLYPENYCTLRLHGRKVDPELYALVRIDFDEAFNYWQEIGLQNQKEKIFAKGQDGKIEAVNQEDTSRQTFKFSKYSHPVLEYRSKAVWKWFKEAGFPVGEQEKHLPPRLFKESPFIKKEFVSALIATVAVFCGGRLRFNEFSESLLNDYETLFLDFGIDCDLSSYDSSNKNLFKERKFLQVTRDATKRLWEQDYCSLNPWLQSRMSEWYANNFKPSETQL